MIFNTGDLKMKKIALAGATLVLVMAAGSVLAANSLNTGTLGLNVNAVNTNNTNTNTNDNFVINGKYFVAKDMAILGGLGIRVAGGDAKGTDLGFIVGVRKYLKTDDLAPFVGGRFTYTSTNDSNITDLGLVAEAGAEYFFAKQFSVEGRVGFGYTSTEDKTTVPTTKATYVGTGTAGISANFYF
jgi:hypothetical protein